jgi:hypothetical protein
MQISSLVFPVLMLYYLYKQMNGTMGETAVSLDYQTHYNVTTK